MLAAQASAPASDTTIAAASTHASPTTSPTKMPPTPGSIPQSVSSSPGKTSLTSWWKGFKGKQMRKEDQLGAGQGIFGIDLETSLQYAHVAISLQDSSGNSFIYGYIPVVVAKCGVYLKEKATDVEGIFRLSGSSKRINQLQKLFDSPATFGKSFDWDGFNVHDAANVLRRYLNNLPEPIVPLAYYEAMRKPMHERPVDVSAAIAEYTKLINSLPPVNKQLLLYLLDLLAVFASKSDINLMPAANLAAIFQPCILNHPQHEQSPDEYRISQDVLVFLVEHQDNFLIGMDADTNDLDILANPQRLFGQHERLSDSQSSTGHLSRSSTVSSKHSTSSTHDDHLPLPEAHSEIPTIELPSSSPIPHPELVSEDKE